MVMWRGWVHREGFCDLHFLRRERLPHHTGPHGKAPGSVRRQTGVRRVSRPELYWGFCRKGKAEQGEQNRIGEFE